MDLFIGLEVSLASTAICVLNARGKVAKETMAASKREELVADVRDLSSNVIAVGLESGPAPQWLHKLLKPTPIPSVV